MKVIDVSNPERINRKPDNTAVLLSDANFSEQGFLINNIELRLYIEKFDKKLGPFSLITLMMETDKGTIEMTYDEGFLGENALEKAKELITKNLGLSGLVLRSIISLREEMNKNT